MTDTTPQLSLEQRSELEAALDHLNASHGDTVLLLARFAGGVPRAVSAEALQVDARGLDLEAATAGGPVRTRLSFGEPSVTPAEMQMAVQAKIVEARAGAGDAMPETSLERELRRGFTLPTHVTSVVAVADLSPNLREVTFSGGLEDFEPLGGDHFVLLMLAPSADGRFPDGFTMADHRALPPSDRSPAAYYTVRAWDPAQRRLAVWMVTHGHADGVGAWARACERGDEVALWGPRGSFMVDEPCGEYLLVADESGLAAVASLLDEIGSVVPVTVILETVDSSHMVALPTAPNVEVTWLFRNGVEPGTSGLLLDAVAGRRFDPTSTTIFGAGESRELAAVRRYVRRDRGVAADRVCLSGYWRRRT